MKNKKSQGLIVIILFWTTLVIIFILLGLWIIPMFFNIGNTTDYVYTVEHTKIGWYKLWLKDDHTTVYCFDDERFIDIIDTAKLDNKKVKVTYQDYWIRGFLCSSGNDKIGTTVVTNIEVIE